MLVSARIWVLVQALRWVPVSALIWVPVLASTPVSAPLAVSSVDSSAACPLALALVLELACTALARLSRAWPVSPVHSVSPLVGPARQAYASTAHSTPIPISASSPVVTSLGFTITSARHQRQFPRAASTFQRFGMLVPSLPSLAPWVRLADGMSIRY